VKDTTARDRAVVSETKGKGVNAVKASACWGNPQKKEYKEKGVIECGCSRHMTGNKCYLTEYEDYDGSFVFFGDGKGRISIKGKIKTGTLDFDNVYFCKELKYNLLSGSQISDKKNNVLFTDAECLVLSFDFKLLDESQVLLKVPRKDNIYSIDLKSVVPTKGLTCLFGLFAKATIDESNIWNRRLGHINFKNINKLVKGNLYKDGHKMDQATRSEFERLLQQEKQTVHPNSINSINIVSTPVSAAGPSFTNDDPSSPVNAAKASNAFEIFGNAYDDEDMGADADLNNLETTMNVSPIPTTRINKDHPKDQIIGDFNLAIQTRRMTKISNEHAMVCYINKQMRTNHKENHNCLFACFLSQMEPKKVIQALEDPSWIESMQEDLLQFQLQKVWTLVNLPNGKRAIGTKWVFRNKKDRRGIVVRNKARLVAQGYTQEDDPQFPNKVYKVEKALYGLHQAPKAWYETLSTYLIKNRFRRGTIDKTLFIKKDKGDILLVQVYVDDIIFGSTKKSLCDEFEGFMHKRFQMSFMGKITFFLGLQVQQKEDGIFISQDKYVAEILKKFVLPLSMIRSLMYLTASRPDIMFNVCACARFQVTPKMSHLHVVKKIFRYLKGQPKLGLWYPRDSLFDLEDFFDSDYARASLGRKSTIGGCQFLWFLLLNGSLQPIKDDSLDV
ncbi:putative ribonuclease H-like domain-containing protein, partial [Tanacetum coccineum]